MTFPIERYAVDGNTVLAPPVIEARLAPFTGPRRTFADVQAAAAALQRAYVEAGYPTVTVQLPEQSLSGGGPVRLRVIETRLRAATVEGQTRFSADNIRRSLPALEPGSVPNTAALTRQMRLANENPAKQIGVDLRTSAADAIDAVISVRDDKPWKLGAVVDDTGTPSTGRLRSGVFFQHANVADLDHVVTAQYITSPDHLAEVVIAALNYRIPIYRLGDSIDLYGVHADVDSGVVSELFNVRGSGSVAGIRYNHALSAMPEYRHRVIYGAEYRLLDNRVGLLGSAPDLVPDVAVHPVSLGYAGTWTGSDRQLDVSATWSRNIPGGHRGRAADLEAARSGASAHYQVVRWALSLNQGLAYDWQMRLATEGQYTRDSLISAEQFGVGGQDSVRGFYEREVTNDVGHRATLELQTPNLAKAYASGLALSWLAFYDVGRVARNRALAGEVAEAGIASAGVGMRIALPPHYTLRFDAAHILRGTASHPRGQDTLHFSLGVVF